MFYVGQKAVCIDDSFGPGPWDRGRPYLPIAGEIYIVRLTGMQKFQTETAPALWLSEVVNPVHLWEDGEIGEIGFSSHRFRPLVERKTDISIFTKILDDVKSKQPISV